VTAVAVRTIRVFGDPVLREPAAPVTGVDDGVRALVRDLLETVAAPGRAGLAAPQIGVGLRAFSYNVDGEVGYVLNPRITALSEQGQDGDEGCLSVPGLWFPTRRAAWARCEGTDLDGNPVVVEGEGLMARCLQHEVDHLDGLLYLSRLEPAVRRQAMRAVRDQLEVGAW
jgi:peptide deformylase